MIAPSGAGCRAELTLRPVATAPGSDEAKLETRNCNTHATVESS
jgi:hypothetical protein